MTPHKWFFLRTQLTAEKFEMDSIHSQFWWENAFTFGVIESDGDEISDWKDSLDTEPLGAGGRRELKIRNSASKL
ncbi:MAG TPA: hypothetical protein VKA67_00530, partial [Verrucomicrobiae bacterium]|nr:hypothetical protein [Verrucomicrobiae bacterium]